VFERFTDQARQVVAAAQEEAARAGDPFIDCTHLLLGVTLAGGPGAVALGRAGVTTDQLRAALPEVSPDALDAEALAALGIDLQPVRAAAESAFGAGALDRPARRTTRRRPGHLPFTAGSREALHRSLRAAVGSEERAIDTRHLVTGILAAAEPRTTAALRHLGVDPEAVRRSLAAAT
jgi:ATP-dependent Clp protease ATP-binding subunit ClpA